MHRSFCCALLCVAASGMQVSEAGDWPMWRFDAGHTAYSPDPLPDQLQPSWTRQYSQRVQVWDDPLNHDLMPYDRIFEPVSAGGRVFVNFNDRDKLVALDAADGSQLWEFFTDGPVRFPAVAWQDKVYFVSDDGNLYCLNAADGKLRWKFSGAPSAQKAIGNHRVISVWPARGAPVLRDGSIYFAASIWPFMGTFIYALDAETGSIQWVNDGTSAQFIKQPHNAPSFAGVAPQGTLSATEDLLLVPGGRSVPAGFDRKTGEFRFFHIGGKGNGGSFVIAGEKEFFVHTRVRGVRSYDLKSGSAGKFTCNEPVIAGDLLFTARGKGIQALDANRKTLWELEVDASGDLIRCGDRLYAAGKQAITAIQLPRDQGNPQVAWSLPVQGQVLRLLAADGRLLAVTLDGSILCFAEKPTKPKSWQEEPVPLPVAAAQRDSAAAVIKQVGAQSGYALAFGADESLLAALIESSRLRIVAVDTDSTQVARLRDKFDAAGVYGTRITVHVGDAQSYQAPPYAAHLVVAGKQVSASAASQPEEMAALYKSVRPFGGGLWLTAAVDPNSLKLEDLEQARAESTPRGTLVMREGALPGAADWTHQYGDIANTVKSDDQRVKLPLGLLWFGGSSNLDVLPRHGHGPPEQVIGGRLIIEGLDCLSARDVYTGRVLWKRTFEDLGTFGIYFDKTYKDTPLSTAYNQVHIPGANGRGTNYVATEDHVYLAIGSECLVLSAATGKTERVIKLPTPAGEKQPPMWGFIGVYEDVLLGGAGFADYSRQLDPGARSRDISDMSASDGLIAFDRHSGKQLWRLDAKLSFLHNGIVAGGGRVYCLDKLPKSAEAKLKRRGLADPEQDRIVTVDAKTGKVLWQVQDDIFGTWLAYAKQHDMVFHAGAKASDRLRDEVGRGMVTFRGNDGSVVWKDPDRGYTGPCILHNDLIITTANSYQVSGGAFRIVDGKPHLVRNPITGKEEPLKFSRAYGCNTVIASENLLTFRSGAAGFYDLAGNSGTGNFGGFKSSCTSNLVIAGGVLNAPDYTRTCTCSYQNQTSLALVHVPNVELWTFNQVSALEEGQSVERLGINLGAPGDRRAENGTLWLDYPSVGGTGPYLKLEASGDKLKYFRHHMSMVKQSELPWVAASGAEGIESLVIHLSAPTKARLPDGYTPKSGEDDAEESPEGLISLDSSDLELVTESQPQTIGIRFPDVRLPSDAEIESAVVQFTVDEASSGKTELTLHAEASPNAAAFREDKFNITSRRKTKSSVRWKPAAWPQAGANGAEQRSPDVTALVREVISQQGWKSGNALALIISGSGKRVAESYNGEKEAAPRLIIKLKGESSQAPPPASALTKRYTVRLHFFEPQREARPRVFGVSLQGQPARKLDLAAETGGARRGAVKVFRGVEISDKLKLEFTPGSGATVLSGVELVAE